MSDSPPSTPLRLLQMALELRDLIGADPQNAEYRFLQFCFANAPNSSAQLFQDLFALYATRKSKSGFFVEFGAADGKLHSNSYLLETKFGWAGILAEPARKHHAALRENRNVGIDTRCVWSESGQNLIFNETEPGEFSTLQMFSERDEHRDARRNGLRYSVETISLNDLLKAHNAPKTIDYLSLDTEGSELDILRAFDFGAYDVSVITVEHNYQTGPREAILRFLNSVGYNRVFVSLSSWDDWYVKRGFNPAA
jgi:FkbM family methyltransferase